jgi:2-dehydropantoate 2-reductase
MRSIIYGAGAIGSVLGGVLFRHGQEAVLIGRQGHVDAINRDGLKLGTPVGNFTLKIPAVTAPDQIEFRSDDVVFLTMKSQGTLEAVKDLKKVVKDIPIFCMQNGVRNEEIASQYFPRVYGVMLRFGTEYLTDGEVVCRRDPPAFLILGRYPNGVDETCEEVATTLRSAEFIVSLNSDVMPFKWGKLMTNLVNAAQAVTGARDPGTTRVIQAAREEAYEIARQAGVNWKSDEEVLKDYPEFQEKLNNRNFGGLTSTWQSLIRQTGTVETEYLNGEIVRLAKRIGLAAPINAKLVEIVLDMAAKREAPGRYNSEQLLELLDIK